MQVSSSRLPLLLSEKVQRSKVHSHYKINLEFRFFFLAVTVRLALL